MTVETVAGLFFSVLGLNWLIPNDATWSAMLIPPFWFAVVLLIYWLNRKLNRVFADRGGAWMDRTKSLNEPISPRRLTECDTPGAVKLSTAGTRHSVISEHRGRGVTHDNERNERLH